VRVKRDEVKILTDDELHLYFYYYIAIVSTQICSLNETESFAFLSTSLLPIASESQILREIGVTKKVANKLLSHMPV
jgi:hypothetical protein